MSWMKPSSSILFISLSRVPFHAFGSHSSLIAKLFPLSLFKNCFLTQILARNTPPWLFQPSESILSDSWWTIQTMGKSLTSWLAQAEPFHDIFWIPKRSAPLLGNKTKQNNQSRHKRTTKFDWEVLSHQFAIGNWDVSLYWQGTGLVLFLWGEIQNPYLGTMCFILQGNFFHFVEHKRV